MENKCETAQLFLFWTLLLYLDIQLWNYDKEVSL